jgi:hypothetical protein
MIILSILGFLIPLFAPFALWQGIKAKRLGDSKWGYIGFLLSNISMVLLVIRLSAVAYGYFSFARL